MTFNVTFDGISNSLVWYNVSDFKLDPEKAPVKKTFETNKFDDLIPHLNCEVFYPINDGEDFVYRADSSFIGLNARESIVGRSFGDMFPSVKDDVYNIFRKVLETGENATLENYVYESDYLEGYFILTAILYDGTIFLTVQNETEQLKLKENEYVSFEQSENPKFIIQDNHIVKINKQFGDLTHCTLEMFSNYTIDILDNMEITYNSTGLDLKYSEIVDKVLNNEYSTIKLHALITEGISRTVYFESVARGINFDNKPAVLITILRELDDVGIQYMRYGSETFELFQEYSQTTFMIYDVETDSYSWNKSLENLIEGPIKYGSDMRDVIYPLIYPEDLDNLQYVEENIGIDNPFLEVKYRIKTLKGNTKYLHVLVKLLIEDGEVKHWLNIFKDVTEYRHQNRKLALINATLKDVRKAANMAVYYRTGDEDYTWSKETYDLIEREPREDDSKHNIIVELGSPEDCKRYKQAVADLAPNKFLGDIIFPITTESGKTKYVKFDARKIYDKEGKFIRGSGYAQDVTSQIEYENALIKTDEEKTVLVKEVYHRLKNNLHVIASLISLEKRFGTDSRTIIDLTQNRIRSLALIHETIYNESDMNYISVKEFINDFDTLLSGVSTFSDINYVNDIPDMILNIDIVNPIVLMINELTTNTFKYAFKEEDENKEIFKSMEIYEDNGQKMCKFHYKDNGIGLPDNFDINKSNSLGWTIIKSLSTQIKGEYELFTKDGFNFVLRFPIFDE